MKKISIFLGFICMTFGIVLTTFAGETEEVLVIGTRTDSGSNADLVDMNYANSPGSMSAAQLSMGYSGKAEYEKKRSLEIAKQQCRAQANTQYQSCVTRSNNFQMQAMSTCQNYRLTGAVGVGVGGIIAVRIPLAGATVMAVGGIVYANGDNCMDRANFQYGLEMQSCDNLRQSIESVCDNIK
jgi:hypothetical protein